MIEKIIEHLKKTDSKNIIRYLEAAWDHDLIAVVKYYYYEKLEWCGCGNPGDALRAIWRYLTALKEDSIEARATKFKNAFDVEHIYDSPLLTCLAYTIDAAGFTEHGSSIYWPWLTEDGRYFCWAIEEAEKEGSLDF